MSKRRINLSIDPDLYFRVKDLADTEERTVRAVAERILIEALDGGRKQAPPTQEELLTMRRAGNVRAYVNSENRISVRNTADEDQNDPDSMWRAIAVFDKCDLQALMLNLQELDREIRLGVYDEANCEAA